MNLRPFDFHLELSRCDFHDDGGGGDNDYVNRLRTNRTIAPIAYLLTFASMCLRVESQYRNISRTHANTPTLKRYYYYYYCTPDGFLNRRLCNDVNEFGSPIAEVDRTTAPTPVGILINNIIKRNLNSKFLVLYRFFRRLDV